MRSVFGKFCMMGQRLNCDRLSGTNSVTPISHSLPIIPNPPEIFLTTRCEQSYGRGMHSLSISLQALVAASIFFVWVVRYDNLIQEFKQYGLPDWLRDLVGILKMTFSLLLLIGIERKLFAVAGGAGTAFLMGCAFIMHLRMKNPLFKMLPA